MATFPKGVAIFVPQYFMSKQVLQKAYIYIVENGYSVIPINKEDKKPAIESWLGYQKVLPEPIDAKKWWNGTDLNIAIITGTVSDLTVIDLDRGKADQKETPLSAFPATYTVETPSGGYHLYYKHTQNIKQSSNAWPQFPHLDIRNDGGYVVAPPSVTAAGEYKIINKTEPIDFPEHLFKLVKNKTRQGMTGAVYFSKMGEGDGRNDALTSYANHMLKILPKNQWNMAIHAIKNINKEFSTPLPEKEVETIVNSMIKRVEPTKEIEFHVNNKGIPYFTAENILILLQNDEDFVGKFRYNTFTGVPETIFPTLRKWCPMMKEHIFGVYVQIQKKYPIFNTVAMLHVESGLVKIAHENEMSPIAEYIRELVWDKKPRLDKWITKTYNVDDNAYHNEIGTNWLLALVKRVMYPGTQMDSVLIVDGDQGAGKSRSFRMLCLFETLGDLFHETSETPDNKDFIISLLGNIVVEFSEGVSVRYTNAMKMKSFITKQSDKYRPPYEKVAVQFPRQCVFAMTTNESQYLKDMTGNRRWYPVSIPRNKNLKVDVDWLIKNRDQLLAEAYAKIDEPHWDLSEESQEHLAILHEEKTTEDPMTEHIVDWYVNLPEGQKQQGILPTQAFKEAVPDSRGFPSPLESKKAGEILVDVLKLERYKKKVKGVRVVRFFPTEATPTESAGIPDSTGFSDDDFD